MTAASSSADSEKNRPNRDNFVSKTRTALALRAGYRCSFSKCGIATAGPSDEASDRHVSIGVAAHITAAAPGGERYDPDMTQEQRASIENGIWLCQTHSRLIDVNPTAYPISLLHQMKTEHEDAIKSEMARMQSTPQCTDFIAVGPDIVFVGELVAVEENTWSFLLDHFVIGDLWQLIGYIDRFGDLDVYDRFVLVNDLGDGRELSCPPTWSKSEKGTLIKVGVMASFPRIDAHRLPMDLALSDEHDLFILNGQLARVSGLDSLPQKIKTCLSTIRGEVFYAPTYGTRIREYSTDFFGSPWLPKLIKLETIRMASIPHSENMGANTPSTPLKAVRKVISVDQISPEGDDGWFAFRFHLDVEGIGDWIRDIKLFISRDI